MKRLLFFLSAGILLCFAVQPVHSQHWHDRYGEVPLRIDSSKVTFRIDPEIPMLDIWTHLDMLTRVEAQLQDDNMIDGFIACSISTGVGLDDYLDSLRGVSWLQLAEPYYLSQQGDPFIVGDGICVAFKPGTSAGEIDSLMALYGADLGREIMTNSVVVDNTEATGMGLLDLANTLHHLPETEFAHPDFNVRPQLCAYKYYDYYADEQQHIKTVGWPTIHGGFLRTQYI